MSPLKLKILQKIFLTKSLAHLRHQRLSTASLTLQKRCLYGMRDGRGSSRIPGKLGAVLLERRSLHT